jgi:hypothetical protein
MGVVTKRTRTTLQSKKQIRWDRIENKKEKRGEKTVMMMEVGISEIGKKTMSKR